MVNLSIRESFSLILLLYINIHLFYSSFNNFKYVEILYINTQIYCLIDVIWILFDQKVRISKIEIIGHHMITLSLLSTKVEHIYRIRVMYLEFSTLLILLSRLNLGYLKNILKNISKVVWFTIRLVVYPCIIINIKLYSNDTIESYNLLFLIYVHLLGLKWTCDSLKITKYINYSSYLLPLSVLDKNLDIYEFSLIFLLTTTSYFHHLIKEKYTLYLDQSSIVNILSYSVCKNIYLSSLISLTNFMVTLKFKSQIITYLLFLIITWYQIIYFDNNLKYIYPFMMYGFYLYYKYKNSLVWHLCNSIYIYLVKISYLE